MWNVVREFIDGLPKSFQEAESEYYQIVIGTATPIARWRVCTALTNQLFEYPAALLYANAHLPEHARKRVRLNYCVGMLSWEQW